MTTKRGSACRRCTQIKHVCDRNLPCSRCTRLSLPCQSRSDSPVLTTAEQNRCPVKPPKPQIRRVQTGCLTCRRRKKKCDEIKTKCGDCRKLCLECHWPSGRTNTKVEDIAKRHQKKGDVKQRRLQEDKLPVQRPGPLVTLGTDVILASQPTSKYPTISLLQNTTADPFWQMAVQQHRLPMLGRLGSDVPAEIDGMVTMEASNFDLTMGWESMRSPFCYEIVSPCQIPLDHYFF